MELPSPLTAQQTLHLQQQNQKLTEQNLLLNQKIKMLEQQMAKMLLEKSQAQEGSKGNVANHKCSHGNHDHDHSSHSHHGHNHSHGHDHHHAHGHNHGHNHGHGHHDESSEEQNPSQPAVPLTPPPPKPFLNKIYKTQQEINFRYFRLPLKTIKAWKKDQNIELTKNKSCMLHMRQMKLNVAEFLSQTWQEVEWINLPECQIDDEGWRIIVENASKSLPDLRVLGIRWNNIKTIKEGDLEQFKNIVNLDLGLQSDENNPLSPQSRQVIKKFTEAHPNIKIE